MRVVLCCVFYWWWFVAVLAVAMWSLWPVCVLLFFFHRATTMPKRVFLRNRGGIFEFIKKS